LKAKEVNVESDPYKKQVILSSTNNKLEIETIYSNTFVHKGSPFIQAKLG